MGRSKRLFLESRSSLLMLKDADETEQGFQPSTSGRSHSNTYSHVRSQLPPEACSTWVWLLPPCSSESSGRHSCQKTAAAASSRSTATRLPWHWGDNGTGNSAAGNNSSREKSWVELWQPWARNHAEAGISSTTADAPTIGCCGGGAEHSRMLLLASLSTSAVAALGSSDSRSRSGLPGGGVASAGRATASDGVGSAGDASSRPQSGFYLPQLSIMRFPGSFSFGEDQDIAQELLDYHIAKNGAFPRNCPCCKSHDFMVQHPEAANPVGAGPSSKVAGTAHATTSASVGRSGCGVVDWRSRPLPCETCGRWIHLGCAGVELVEQVPPRPWFHSQSCRDTFLRLEAAAERNPHPSSASPTHALYVFTPADHLAAAAVAAAAGGAGREGGRRRELPANRGPAGAVVPLLAQGFNSDTIQGFCQPAREYDGGKYSALLLSRGKPVAAATFNVFGADAQLCLLATAVQHRSKGNGSALVADIETILGSLGVRRMLVQARSPALPLWLGSLGYDVVAPEEAEELHHRLPLAYYDCALLDKSLSAGASSDREGVVH